MDYTKITDEVFDILNAFIPEVFEAHQQFEKEIAALPQDHHLPENAQQYDALRTKQKENIAAIITGRLNNSLPGIVEGAALWYKGTERPEAERVWVISPYEFDIMGRSIVSIALQHKEKLEIGIFANFTDAEVITGAIGEGAEIDNEKITVNNKKLSAEAVVMKFVIPPASIRGTYAAFTVPISRKFDFLPMSNKVAENLPPYLTLVARGKVDLVLATGFRYHDVAAAICIAEHAGAIVTDFSGNRDGLYTGESLICCNETIYAQIKELTK